MTDKGSTHMEGRFWLTSKAYAALMSLPYPITVGVTNYETWDVNKCDECCQTVGCEVCGPCPKHDKKETQ